MISPYDIGTSLIDIVSDKVGSLLAQVPAQGGVMRPACIRSSGYDSGTQSPVIEPPYPFIAVNFIAANRFGNADILNEYLNGDENLVQETDVLLSYEFRCHGLVKDDVVKIVSVLSRWFETPSIRDKIQNDTGGRLFSTSNISKINVRLRTNIVEVGRFVIEISIRDSLVDIDSGMFNTININTVETGGGLYESPDDTNPLPIQVEAP